MTSVPNWIHSQNSVAAAEALSSKISCYGTSLKWSPKPTQWRESHCRTNTSVKRKKEIQKSRTVRVRVRNQRRKVKVTRSINSTIIDYTVLTIDIKVSKEGMSPPSPSLVALDFMGWEEGVAGELWSGTFFWRLSFFEILGRGYPLGVGLYLLWKTQYFFILKLIRLT